MTDARKRLYHAFSVGFKLRCAHYPLAYGLAFSFPTGTAQGRFAACRTHRQQTGKLGNLGLGALPPLRAAAVP